MALQHDSIGQNEASWPLSTGFTYRDRSEVEGFELRPDIVEWMDTRLSQLESYHRRPSDADPQPV